MSLRRSSHNVYDTQYHLVWAPKYRKKILTGVVNARMRELLFEIAECYRIEEEELEVSVDHVHVFCSFPPKLSITQVVTCLKSLIARTIFVNILSCVANCGVANFGRTVFSRARWVTE